MARMAVPCRLADMKGRVMSGNRHCDCTLFAHNLLIAADPQQGEGPLWHAQCRAKKPDFFCARTALKDSPQGSPPANCRQPPPTTNRQTPTAANRHQPPTAIL